MENLLSKNLFFILLIMLTSGCNQKEKSTPADLTTVNGLKTTQTEGDFITVPIDLNNSVIKWRGTKLGGIRGHEGTIEFERGDFFVKNDAIIGGYFLINMRSLEVTDIPDEQAIAKNNLKEHLKSEFKTTAYPQSVFEITNVKYISPEEVQVQGNLTVRGITKSILVPLKVQDKKESDEIITSTAITLDRKAWNIGEDGSWLEKRVVDDEFYLNISIVY